jgi:hypothetical protein
MPDTSRRDVLAGAAGLAAGSALSLLPSATAPAQTFVFEPSSGSPAMTQNAYTMIVHGGDHDAMQAALVHYQQLCKAMMENGNQFPFASNHLVMDNLLRQTSAANAEAVEEFCEACAMRKRPAA